MAEADPVLGTWIPRAQPSPASADMSPADDSGWVDGDLPLSLRGARWIALAQAGVGIAGVLILVIGGLSVASDLGGAAVGVLLLGAAAGLVVPVALLALALLLDDLDTWVRNALFGLELIILISGAVILAADPLIGLLSLPFALGAVVVMTCLVMPAAREMFAVGWDDDDSGVTAAPTRSGSGPDAGRAPADTSFHELVAYWKGLFSRR